MAARVASLRPALLAAPGSSNPCRAWRSCPFSGLPAAALAAAALAAWGALVFLARVFISAFAFRLIFDPFLPNWLAVRIRLSILAWWRLANFEVLPGLSFRPLSRLVTLGSLPRLSLDRLSRPLTLESLDRLS